MVMDFSGKETAKVAEGLVVPRAMFIRAPKSDTDTDSPTPERVEPEGDFWSLEELQAFVGGYIELVRVPYGYLNSGSFLLVVNEEGIPKGLPLNFLATIISGSSQIYGDALITHEAWMED